jgi:hypothetical protein
MKHLLFPLLLLLTGCEPTTTDNSMNNPILIADKDGTKLWKVKDTTSGGQLYVYFSTSKKTPVISGSMETK